MGDIDRDEVRRYIDEVADRAEGKAGSFDGTTTVPEAHHPAAAAHLGVARDHAHMGTEVPAGARLRRAKKLLVTALRPVTNYQTTFNAELADALAEVLRSLDEVAARAESGNAQLYGAVATAEARADQVAADLGLRLDADAEERAGERAELRATIEGLEVRLAEQDQRLADQGAEISHLRARLETESRLLRGRQDVVLRAAREALGHDGPQPLTALSRELARSYDELYRDLETTFRGSPERVKALMEVYLPDVADLGGGPVLDIGCGRGEWLELLAEHDVPAYGVDTNTDFVTSLHERGLDVRSGDALAHLSDLPEGSLRAVTGHHLAEHLSLDTLVALLDAALHALQPGGVLILETPNPTNLKVGAASFYLDPTHLKPLHPQFLEFLTLSRGFVDAEVRFLHGEDVALDAKTLGDGPGAARVAGDLAWALYGPLDYAVVARKVGSRP